MLRRELLLPAALLLPGCIPSAAPSRAYEPVPRATPTPTPRPSLELSRETLSDQPPVWEMRPVAADAKQIPASVYTVRSGDSLRLIAVKTGAGSEAIARANNLSPPYTIHPGQRLAIPAGRYHIVRDGETGIAIARAYGVDWGRVVTVNYLEEPYILRAGQRILIPSQGPETLEERAARFHLDIDDIVTGGQPALAANEKPRAPTTSTKPLPSSATVSTPSRLSGQFRWPVDGNIVKRFGPGASGEINDGIKIAVPLDTPILAAADGVVAYAGSDIPALGGLVILRHGDAWTTVYGHAGQLLVRRGQSVKKGQMIALSGNSGFAADRPEVHFEIRQGRTPVDPIPRLPKR